MKLAGRIVLLAMLGGLGCWLWTVIFPSPEKVILKKIAALAATANISAADGNITRAAKATSAVNQFSTDAEIDFDVPGFASRTVTGRDEIRETAMGGFASVPALKVQFMDAAAHLGPDKQTADVSCTAEVTAGDSKDLGIQELRFHMKKIDGDWLITKLETVKTFR